MESALCCFSWAAVFWAATPPWSSSKLAPSTKARASPVLATRRMAGCPGRQRPQSAPLPSWQMLALPVGRPDAVGKDYAFGAQLGIGGFGVVWAAKCFETGEVVAVKEIVRSRILGQVRLHGEVTLAASMRHPHIVRLYEVYMDRSSVHLVMEHCSGGELHDRMVAAPQGVGEHIASLWVRQMLSALGYLHWRSIVHRDVKPDNFLFEYPALEAPLKLTDFGFSRNLESGKTLSTMVGAPYYMAPEVLAQSYNERADIWSMGVIAYALLCGQVPFQAKSPQGVFRKVKKGKPSFIGKQWSQVSDAAVGFVTMLLTFNYLERPAAEDAQFHAWLRQPPNPCDFCEDEAVIASRRRVFAARPLPERVAMAAAAWHLPGEQTQAFAAMYTHASAASCGCVKSRGAAESSDEQLERRLEQGTVDYATWLAASVPPSLLGQAAVVKAAVRALDPDRDGCISFGDICRAADALAPALGPPLWREKKACLQVDAEAIEAVLMSGATSPAGGALDEAPWPTKTIEWFDFNSSSGLVQHVHELERKGADGSKPHAGGSKRCSSESPASASTASSRTLQLVTATTVGEFEDERN
mmetsp:Transcript_44670/g.130028  ORF Transcript_44670/g.130028 Transcript_44670/m.130028 type:complete len:584 (-) Transcript_44670:303-2054(-)